jgi:hypothetical protein
VPAGFGFEQRVFVSFLALLVANPKVVPLFL